MSSINPLFEVRKTGDQEVVVRFPKEIEIGERIDANSLLKGMIEIALSEEPDVVGQRLDPNVFCIGKNDGLSGAGCPLKSL